MFVFDAPQIDKKQFKIGSLEVLMQLNETAARIDAQLEVVVKKIERVESETRQVEGAAANAGGNLVYKSNYTDTNGGK